MGSIDETKEDQKAAAPTKAATETSKPSDPAQSGNDTKDKTKSNKNNKNNTVKGKNATKKSETPKDGSKPEKSREESVKVEKSEAPKKKNGNSRIYKILIDRAKKDDSGLWRMEVSNNFGKVTATCTVKVLADADFGKQEVPSFLDKLANEKTEENAKVVFRCKSTGVPEPEVKWYKDEIPIDNGVHYYISSNNGRHKLELPKVHMRDMAIYKCKALNRAGWAACDAKLFITEAQEDPFLPYIRQREFTLAEKIKARRALDAPSDADMLVDDFIDSEMLRKFMIKWKSDGDQTLSFVSHLSSKCAVEGALVSLNCHVKGMPPFKIRWYKDDNEIFEGSKYFLRNRNGILCLDILSSNEDDTGNYTCEVRTDQGKIYTSCYLQVEPMLDITNEVPRMPTFVTPMKRVTVNEDEVIRFRVTANGYPSPGFKWFKDATEVHDSDRITSEVKKNGVAQLIIERANVQDIGLYMCEAHNLAGRARSMVRVSVRDKFEMEEWRAKNFGGQDVETNIKTDGYSVLRKGLLGDDEHYIPQYATGEFSMEPMFTIQLPRTITIKERGRFLLECCCSGTPKPVVKWFKDGEELQPGPKFMFLNVVDWYGLEVIDALPGDVGTYSAKMVNGVEQSTTCKVDLELPKALPRTIPTVVESPHIISKDVVIYITEQECTTFEKMGMAGIVPSSNLCNTEIDWTASIDKEVEVIDAMEAPSFSSRLPDKITPVVNKDSIKLDCIVKGEPVPQIGWLKDGKKLTESDHVKFLWDPESSAARLVIDKPQVDDSGKYTCVAYTKGGGHAESVTIVEVKGSDSASQGQGLARGGSAAGVASGERTIPDFKVKLRDIEVTPGSDLKLECKIMGEPVPKITWYKNEEPLTNNVDRCSISSIKGIHSLKIRNVLTTDTNTYRCVAVNELGAVSSTVNVFVQEKPEAKPGHPHFTTTLSSVTVEPFDRVCLQCIVKGEPVPKITWKKNGVDVTHKYRTEQSDKGEVSLRIKSVSPEDLGSYVCIAENSSGKAESKAVIKVYDPRSAKQSGGRDDASDSNKMPGALFSDDKVKAGSKKSAPGSDEDLDAEDKSAGYVDYKRRPKFLEQPWSQWVMKNEPFSLSFEVVKSEDLAVAWFHNDVAVSEGRFKVAVKDV